MAVIQLDGLGIPFGILSPNKMYSTDAFAGPYESIEDAMDTVNASIRIVGREVGIYANDHKSVDKYSFALNSNDQWVLIKNQITLPTLISAFQNDAGYITLNDLPVTNIPLVGVKVNGTDLTIGSDKKVNITIPTKTSNLTNDSGFITLNDLNYPNISGKLDKVSTQTTKNQVYVKKADGTQTMVDIDTIGKIYVSPDDTLYINDNQIKLNLNFYKESFDVPINFAVPINITTSVEFSSITNIFFNGICLDISDYEVQSPTQIQILDLSEAIWALFVNTEELNKVSVQGVIKIN